MEIWTVRCGQERDLTVGMERNGKEVAGLPKQGSSLSRRGRSLAFFFGAISRHDRVNVLNLSSKGS